MKDKYDILREKIEERLSAPNVIDNGEIISLMTLQDTLKSAMGNYNSILVNNSNDIVKRMNSMTRMNRLFKGDYPYIQKLCPIIEENGNCYIDIIFSDNNGRYVGKARVDDRTQISYDLLRTGYDDKKTSQLIRNFQLNYLYIYDELLLFSYEYPNTRFEWNTDYEPAKQKIDDGFISAYYKLDELNKTSVTLSNLEDIELARIHTRKYGELYDYISFYQGKIMRSTPVNSNDLNDLYQQIVRKELKLNDNMSLKRVK